VRPEQIETYLRHKIPIAADIQVSGLCRVMGGASRETWSFDARWREHGQAVQRGFILRRDPDASLLESDRYLEFRVYQALSCTAIPVPRVYWLETDPSWLERPFFIMGRIDGCQASPQSLAAADRYSGIREEIGRRKAEILAQIHSLDWASLGLDFLNPPPPRQCTLEEITKWERTLERNELEPQPVLRAGIQWLRQHLPPPPARVTLVHGDYRTGNFLYTPQGTIEAILDWEMAHLGDPMEDMGWACSRPWRFAGDDRVGGLLDREKFLRLYEQYSGIPVDREAVRFWELLANLKLAVILLTGGRSFVDGRTQNAGMARSGRNADSLSLNVLEIMNVLGDCP